MWIGLGNAIDASKDEEQSNILNDIDVGVAVEQPDIVKEIQTSAYSTWSTMFDSKDSKRRSNSTAATAEITTDETTQPDKLDTMTSILQYNPLNSLASSWINDLQKESIAKDPHHELRTHLESHLKDFPKSTYEMWVEEALTFAGDIAVVDETFYRESSIHRNIWNDKMAELDPNVGGEYEVGGGETSASEWTSRNLSHMDRLDRCRYVPARPPRTEKAEEAGTQCLDVHVAVASSSSTAKTTSDKSTTPVKKVPSSSTKTSIPKADDDADLDNLLDDSAIPPPKTPPKVTAAPTPNKSNPILEASALLDDEDADLDGLLGGDDDSSGEVVFVSSSPSC